MRKLACIAASVAALIGAPTSGSAQPIETPAWWASPPSLVSDPQQPGPVGPSTPEETQQTRELQRWMRDFTEWKQWWAEWANRREPGWFTSSRPRRAKPAPPEWLETRCAGLVEDTELLAHACSLLAEWQEDDLLARSRAARGAVIQDQEDPTKTIWWERIHVDMLWPATELRSHVFGVIGVHTATPIKGRFHVFLTPGVMLLNLPAADGTRVWKVAANYGIGFQLFDFSLPGNRRASLHLNFAKSWLVTDTRDLLVAKNLDFAGFSMTFKRR
jgi:hypothetical protein